MVASGLSQVGILYFGPLPLRGFDHQRRHVICALHRTPPLLWGQPSFDDAADIIVFSSDQSLGSLPIFSTPSPTATVSSPTAFFALNDNLGHYWLGSPSVFSTLHAFHRSCIVHYPTDSHSLLPFSACGLWPPTAFWLAVNHAHRESVCKTQFCLWQGECWVRMP